MFRIAIVEDQDETRECLNRFVRQYAEEQGVQVEISLITDGSEIAEHYTPGFDIIFMDVEMPRLDGFGAAEAIRAVDAEVVLVFVTNMAQYAIRGYEVDALDYVLKPVNYYQFCTKLSRAIQRVQRRRGGQVVLQLAGGGIQLLDTADIYYLETRSRMLYYHTAKGEFAVRASLQSAEKQLAEYHFVRCNQCYLVNISIHALREEGDQSRRRAQKMRIISIHALREEGDSKNREKTPCFCLIIHLSAQIAKRCLQTKPQNHTVTCANGRFSGAKRPGKPCVLPVRTGRTSKDQHAVLGKLRV